MFQCYSLHLSHRSVIVKCGMPRVKKEDDSVRRRFKNKSIPEPEQMRQPFGWADGAVDKGSWGRNYQVVCRFLEHISGSTCSRPVWSLCSWPWACAHRLLMHVCVSYFTRSNWHSLSTVLLEEQQTHKCRSITLYLELGLCSSFSSPLFLSTSISSLKRAH